MALLSSAGLRASHIPSGFIAGSRCRVSPHTSHPHPWGNGQIHSTAGGDSMAVLQQAERWELPLCYCGLKSLSSIRASH